MGCCFSGPEADAPKPQEVSKTFPATTKEKAAEVAAAAAAAKHDATAGAVKLEDVALAGKELVGDEVTEEIKCSQVWVGQIIGAGGTVIAKLKETTGADIDVGDSGEDPVTISIKGSRAAVTAAKTAVVAIIKEAEDPDYEGEKGKALRAKADELAQKMEAAAKEKDALFDKGDKSGGHAKLAEVKEFQKQMHEANAAAAEAIFEHRNSGKGDRYMDFHGLRKQEAMDILEKRLGKLKGGEVELVPGAGHHSSGAAVLKPAMEAYLKENGFKFEEKNAGTLVVKLP